MLLQPSCEEGSHWAQCNTFWKGCRLTFLLLAAQRPAQDSLMLGSHRFMWLQAEAIIRKVGLNCTQRTGPMWPPLSTHTCVNRSPVHHICSMIGLKKKYLDNVNHLVTGVCIPCVHPAIRWTGYDVFGVGWETTLNGDAAVVHVTGEGLKVIWTGNVL